MIAPPKACGVSVMTGATVYVNGWPTYVNEPPVQPVPNSGVLSVTAKLFGTKRPTLPVAMPVTSPAPR